VKPVAVKLGRNDPCPCGSGKKYKKCCGQDESEGAAAGPRIASSQSLKVTPDELRQLVALGQAGQYHDVETQARGLVGRDPSSGFAWKALGISLIVQGKDALQALQTAKELLPDDAEVRNCLGNALQGLGQLDEAVINYRRALQIKPDFAQVHSNLSVALLDLDQADAAVAASRRALQIKPDYAPAHNNLGNALQRLERFDEAAASCRRALQFKPDFAEAHNNLGNSLQSLRQFDEAVASCRRALELKPDFAEAHNNLGNSLQSLGQFDEALVSCRRALQLKPDFAEAHNNLGSVLLCVGQLDEAVASLRQALQLKPDFAKAHNNLGSTLRELERPDEAVVSYRRAVQINPQFALAHANLGVTLRRMGRIDEAEPFCRSALELKPDSPEALMALAGVRAAQGQFAEAEDLYRRAISIEPQSPDAWFGIANGRKMTGSDAAWLAEAQRIAEQHLPPRKEMPIRYAIGKCFDDVENFEQAFNNYQRANELTKQFAAKYDRQHLTQAVDLIIHSYDKEWFSKVRSDASQSVRPVFIVGMPRSGTTLAEQILASHPAVFGAGELPYWNNASWAYESSRRDDGTSERTPGELGNDYLRLLEGLSTDALRVVDKMPGNFLHLGLIHAAFPHARIIHMRRNPIDTCLSIYFQNFTTGHSYANDLENLAHYFSEYRRVMEHWRSTLPADAILDLPYEELVEDQETWSRKMVQFIDLPWDPRCLDFHRASRTVNTASQWQVRQQINKASVARWRNYEKFVGPLLPLLQ
jgi:tetratricopeptide (TPR) repeat protein